MGNSTVGVYAGSFDPLTNGHMFMILKGSRLFGELIVAVGSNPNKHYAFTVPERVEMLRECTKEFENVRVDHFEGLFLVDYARNVGADCIVRGIRSHQDYEFERAMRNINEDLSPDLTTVFLIPPREICEVSSSFVKGLVGPKGWEKVIKPYVPVPVYERLLQSNVRWHTLSAGHETATD